MAHEHGRPYLYSKEKEDLLKRMHKIEGQARGISKMIEDGRYCLDIVQQCSALSQAGDEVALLILQNHIEGCISEAIQEQRGEPYIKELMQVVRKAVRR